VALLYQITDSDYEALAEFRYQIRRFLHFSERSARTAGVEPHQHQFLLALRGLSQVEREPSIRMLAERLQIKHHSAVELVDRLEERGLVSRSRAASDRRQAVVRLTARGEAELEKLSMCHMAELRDNGPALVAALEAVIRRTNGSN
jgi:DNA-binding MarR family transcriptional regulator